MVGGHRVQGRFVADEAYAAYLKGVVLETEGRLDAAMAAYGEAIQHDPDSAEIWTRIGALRCADVAKPGAAVKTVGPWDAFARAAEIDPSYEETWTERARCHLSRGELDEAVRAARMGVSLDPDRDEPAVLLALALERQGHADEARRWLDGLVARHPSSVTAHEAMAAFAGRTHDDARRQSSEDALSVLRPGDQGRAHRSGASLSMVDSAILRGEFERARSLALGARISSGALAVRAAALGSVDFARSQAEFVLAADPADADARVAALVAADLARDEAALARALAGTRSFSAPPSPLGILLLGELLGRRVGTAAETALVHAAGPLATEGDDLAQTVARRSRPTR
jgi:tetratricopeptide (TPR) repeat protein